MTITRNLIIAGLALLWIPGAQLVMITAAPDRLFVPPRLRIALDQPAR